MTIHQPLWLIRVCVVALVAFTVAACSGLAPTKEPTAGNMMPNLADYNINDVQNIQDAIAKLTSAASLVSGQPEVTAAIAGLSSVVSCFQSAGAIQGRTYVNKSNPLYSGVVLIVNKNVLTDPQTWVNCTIPRRSAAVPQGGIQLSPCAKTYTLNKDNNTFYVAYAATDQRVCSAFCSALEGCTP